MRESVVTDCTEHPHCIVHVYGDFPKEPGSWASHFDDDVDPAVRIASDHPEPVQDRRKGKAAGARVSPRAASAAESKRLRGETPRPN